MQKKKGISLIVLVITIIVMIVLAGAIILSLNNAGIIGNANKAVSESDYKAVQTAAQLVYADIMLGKNTGDLWTGQYIKEQLIADGVINAEQATMYRFRNNGEVIKLQTEAEYNTMYKTELDLLDASYYTITDGTFKLTTAGMNAIKESNLTTVAIPYGVTTIGSSAFKECTNLIKVIMPDTVTSIGMSAFKKCTNLATIVFSESYKDSGYDTFTETKWLQDKMDGLESGSFLIEKGVLIAAKEAKGDIEIPEGVEVISCSVFNRNQDITSVIIPSSVEEIGLEAFQCCFKVKSVKFLGNMPDLGDASFTDTNIGDDDTYNKMCEKNPSAFDF